MSLRFPAVLGIISSEKKEVRFMKSIPIKLSFAEEVKAFVNTVNRYNY